MLDAGVERDDVESDMFSPYQPDRHKMGSDQIESWINEVSLASDSAAENSRGTWEISPSIMSFGMSEDFGDSETARSIKEDNIQSLEHVRRQSHEFPSTTMETTHETSRTTDHESNGAEATPSLSRFSRLEAMWQRRRDRREKIQLSETRMMEQGHHVIRLSQNVDHIEASMDATTIEPAVPQVLCSPQGKATRDELQADIKDHKSQRQSTISLLHDLRNQDIELDGQSTSSTRVNVSTSHGNAPKQLQAYYDTVKEVMCMQKKLSELYTERDEQLTRSDQNWSLDPSNEDFTAIRTGELSCTRKPLDEARADLQIVAAGREESNLDNTGGQFRGWSTAAHLTYTSAKGRENARSTYTTSGDQPDNDYPGHNSVPGAKMRVLGPQKVYSSIGKPRIVRETRLPSTLNGHEISAVPDVGAAANFIALRYVHKHGLIINHAARKLVQTAVGSAVDILGTVTLPFSFKNEEMIHHLTFNVMREAVHDVIIGSPFLKLTKTYTRYKHRLQQMLREVRLPRLRFLGSHQYVRGWVDGAYVDAVPDTGADVPVMSLAFAEQHGFIVDTNAKHRILLQFADGSTATTLGIVRDMNWSFGSSEVQHHIDVYVLEELQTDLILDNNFLYDTNAFVVHERDFWTADSEILGDSWMVSIIKLVDRVLKGSRPTNSGKYFGRACRWHLKTRADIHA
jgi:hypothetical protein